MSSKKNSGYLSHEQYALEVQTIKLYYIQLFPLINNAKLSAATLTHACTHACTVILCPTHGSGSRLCFCLLN